MTITSPAPPITHETTVQRLWGGDYFVTCSCRWSSYGWYHHHRAELAGERHVEAEA